MEENQIIQLYWDRDPRAISVSDEAYGPYCRAIAGRILSDLRDREECINDTWLRAWNTMPPRWPERLRLFLGTITRNLALSRWEQASAQKRGGGELPLALEELSSAIPAGQTTEQAAEARELTAALERFLAALPQQARIIFLRRYWYLLPVKDIARSLSLGESAVKMSLSRSRKKLKAFLEQEGIKL